MSPAWVHFSSKCGFNVGQKCKENFDTISQICQRIRRVPVTMRHALSTCHEPKFLLIPLLYHTGSTACDFQGQKRYCRINVEAEAGSGETAVNVYFIHPAICKENLAKIKKPAQADFPAKSQNRHLPNHEQ